MSLKELEIKCDKCGYMWTPRKDTPKRCPKCKNVLTLQPKRFLTKGELHQNVTMFFLGALTILFVGALLSLGFNEPMGVVLGVAGFTLCLTFGMPFWVEYRIYDVLHRNYPPPPTPPREG